jgi:hypothetical protein
VNEHQTTSLRNPATGATALVLFDADLIATPASLTQIVGLDSSGRNELTLLKTTLPLVLGIVGGVVLLAGIFLSRKRRDDMDELDVVARGMATSAAAEPAQGRHAAELAGVLPVGDDETQELAAEEGEGPDIPGPRHARSPATRQASLPKAQSACQSQKSSHHSSRKLTGFHALIPPALAWSTAQSTTLERVDCATGRVGIGVAAQDYEQVPGRELAEHRNAQQGPAPVRQVAGHGIEEDGALR